MSKEETAEKPVEEAIAFKQTAVTVHPSADLFPMLSDAELQELANSIKTHGLREKIKVDRQGVVIDGRNRLAAMTVAEIQLKPEHVEVIDFDATKFSIDEYIVMANIERRNLTREQRRELSGKLAVTLEKAQEDKPKAERIDTTKKAADAAGVSRRTAATAKQEALVNMGLRKAPTPQNESKTKKPTKVEQKDARPPAVVKALSKARGVIHATGSKWPENRKEQAVKECWDILGVFGTTMLKNDIPEHIKGLLGLPKNWKPSAKLEVVKGDGEK